jgi:pimeloyl-ACP methyl ester carboxylesterase
MKPLMRLILLALPWALPALAARAEVLVLVHGYLGSASSWESSGVVAALESNGWSRAGVLTTRQDGQVGLWADAGQQADNKYYLVDLPSKAPISFQSRWLGAMLASIRAMHPEEGALLVGHSAGGVVARAALVQGLAPEARALITIASPHLGASRAAQALDFTNDSAPVGWLKGLVVGDKYQEVKHSQQLLMELLPATPGSYLYNLNQQEHPNIDYISIVRPGPAGMGDELVPAFSQDMNQVAKLRGRSKVRLSASNHVLDRDDGRVLAELLKPLSQASSSKKQ